MSIKTTVILGIYSGPSWEDHGCLWVPNTVSPCATGEYSLTRPGPIRGIALLAGARRDQLVVPMGWAIRQQVRVAHARRRWEHQVRRRPAFDVRDRRISE